MKISIIMPTYNDAESIKETLDSISSQTYKNWQLIIMNDGSTDNVESVITSYIKNSEYSGQIEYYYQSNQDQLNAISNGIKYILGDYVYILHSDDLLPSEDFLEKMVEQVKNNPSVDVFIGDLELIDENSNHIGVQKVSQYIQETKVLSKLMLWLGRNLYSDVIFAKKEVFKCNIHESYLTWNMPFWIKLSNKTDILNVKNVDFPFLKYRVHGGNYINNELGKLNVINGELRTITRLMEFYNIPLYKYQFYMYRVANKINLGDRFIPIHFNKQEKHKGSIVEFVIEKRFGKQYKSNFYLNNLVGFYKNNNLRSIELEKISSDEIIYKGRDMRIFNKHLMNNELSDFYKKLIYDMGKGITEIVVRDEEDKEKIIDITKFLCIYPYVKVVILK